MPQPSAEGPPRAPAGLTDGELASLARTAAADRRDARLSASVGGTRRRAAVPPALGAYVARALAADAPTPAAEHRLVRRARDGDVRAREELIAALMPRLVAIARRHAVGSAELADLLQEGVMAVLEALARFDPDRGVPFWAYATSWVRGAMSRLAHDQRRALRLPPRAMSDLAALKEASARLSAAEGREPPLDRVAAAAGVDLSRARSLAVAAATPATLDAGAGERDDTPPLGDALADPGAEAAYDEVAVRALAPELRILLGTLSERERDVLEGRFGLEGREEESLAEAGRRLGLSRERVRRIESRALSKLRLAFGEG